MATKGAKTGDKTSAQGDIYVVSAPSGAGKTTLCRKLCASLPRLRHSVSHTTREPRKNEKNNVHYTFVSEETFRAMIKKGEFAEWAVVHGNLYGTSSRKLLQMRDRGHDVILDIDVQGAQQLRRSLKEAVYIFILPPSLKILEKRLRGRMSERPAELKERLGNAREEMKHYTAYDYIVINDELKKALREMESIIIAGRLRRAKVDSRLLKNLK
jgi:guanylate kinase